MLLYTRLDGTDLSWQEAVANSAFVLLYTATILFCYSNIKKFWRMRTAPISIFYLMTMLTLVSRTAFFILRFFTSLTYWNFILLQVPELCFLGVIISQIMIYAIMRLELSTYLKTRDSASRQTRASTSHALVDI